MEARREKAGKRDEIQTTVPAHKNESKSMVLIEGYDINTGTHDGGLESE